MDATGPQGVRQGRVRSSRVVLAPRCWSQVCGIFRRRWWLKSPAHQEERGAAVNPLRRECRSDFGVPVLACVRLFCFARKAVGAACTRHSLRPPLSEGENDTRLGRKSRRGNAKTCSFVVAKSVARVSDHGRCDSTTESEATPAAPAYRCAHAGYTRCCQPRRANEEACLLARIASQVRQDGQRGRNLTAAHTTMRWDAGEGGKQKCQGDRWRLSLRHWRFSPRCACAAGGQAGRDRRPGA